MTDEQNQSTPFDDVPLLRQYASVIAKYLHFRCSARTARFFYHRFETFIKWAEEVERDEDREVLHMPIEVVDVIEYARALDERGLSYPTVRVYVSAIGTMHNIVKMYSPTTDVRVKSFLADLRATHLDSLPYTRTLSDNDIKNILDNLHHPRKLGRGVETLKIARQRTAVDKALLLVMLQAGMRRSEASNLVWRAVFEHDDGSGRLLLREKRASEGKAWVAITAYCLQLLFDIKPEGADDNALVFNMSDSQVNRRIKRMCAEAGIDPKNVSAHTLRASLLRLMVDRGAPVGMIEQHLRLQPHPLMHADDPRTAETLRWLGTMEKPTA